MARASCESSTSSDGERDGGYVHGKFARSLLYDDDWLYLCWFSELVMEGERVETGIKTGKI